ncbi:hypothetical protein A0J61_00123 [Choanephora cucurbitarum]|uniref:Uncharacterized protein n=1 Tax=Choanephora cucurbitarum TaxID=101091 RepID=A0A1C7NRU4_9FUNG|nr:hypothetical protein A0J61_00123 [Choanephora cucurbitarum]
MTQRGPLPELKQELQFVLFLVVSEVFNRVKFRQLAIWQEVFCSIARRVILKIGLHNEDRPQNLQRLHKASSGLCSAEPQKTCC